MKSAKQILIEARNLIATPETWIKGAFARTIQGDDCYEHDCRAVAWCALGAIQRQSEDWESADKAQSIFYSANCHVFTTIWVFNDSATHKEVLRAFDKAIESIPDEVG